MFKMKKTVSILVVLTILMGVLTACTAGDKKDNEVTTTADSNTLVVYTARSESLNNAVIPNFEKDTGIKVEMIVAGTGELVKRVESEKSNPMGDILWAADETML